MLQGGFMSVMEVRSQDELRSEVVRFANDLGFEKVTATTVIDHPLAQPEFFSVDNTPAAYRETFEDTHSSRLDPVMQHCKHASVPIIWDQHTYTSCGLGEKWEAQARYGYRTGIALALHLPEGKHFLLGVDRDQPVPAHKGELTRVVADLQLFAVLAQDAALRILVPAAVAGRVARAHAARARMPALDDGWQDRMGDRLDPRHRRAYGGAACQQRHAQARLRQQASGRGEGVAPRAHTLSAALSAACVRSRAGLP